VAPQEDDLGTDRRTLGTGQQDTYSIRAAQAGLRHALSGVRLSDLEELRTRGVLGAHPSTTPRSRRTLGAGGRMNTIRQQHQLTYPVRVTEAL
jgi:hypothetical protein